MTQENVYIVSGCRTGIGSFNGQYSRIPAKTLGATVIKGCLDKSGVPAKDVEEVIMGQVLTAGNGQNPARQASLEAGLPIQTPAFLINQLCGSGLQSVQIGYRSLLTGDASIVICGGQENMTTAQHSAHLRNVRLGDVSFKDTLLRDGLTDAMVNLHMGATAEHLAKTYKVSRAEQDSLAFESQTRASRAIREGYFKEEIVPVNGIVKDEFVKPECTLEKLSQLPTAFEKDPAKNPSVTSGNASGINDGAAAVLLCNETQLKARKLVPLAKIVGFASAGNEPIEMGIAPIVAVQKLLQKVGWNKDEVDLYELNEAFASQSLIVVQKLGVDLNKVNVTGGAIALGHPIGASGTRVLVTLLYNMKRLNVKKGVASLCIGGGMGIAIAVERTN